MCIRDRDYNTTFPARADKMVWYKDAGEVAMHSAPEDTGKDLALSFRSSKMCIRDRAYCLSALWLMILSTTG